MRVSSFGQPLYRSSADGDAVLTPEGEDRATPYHLEAYYRFQVSDNISITPGAFILAPHWLRRELSLKNTINQ